LRVERGKQNHLIKENENEMFMLKRGKEICVALTTTSL
jgi:hypothetical protein